MLIDFINNPAKIHEMMKRFVVVCHKLFIRLAISDFRASVLIKGLGNEMGPICCPAVNGERWQFLKKNLRTVAIFGFLFKLDLLLGETNLQKINTAWVTGKIRFTPSQQPYFVCACSNCHKKVDTGCDWLLHCSACGAYEEVELRCRIPVELEGNQQTIRVVLTSPDVERLTGLSGEKMRDAHQFDFNVNDDLLLSLDRLQVVCFLKRYDRRSMGTPAGPGLRYSAVKTYALDAMTKPTPSLPPPSAECSKQMQLSEKNEASQSVMPKKITPENAAETKEGTAQETSKRRIQFISAEDNQPDNTEPQKNRTPQK